VFTGIIKDLGTVKDIKRKQGAAVLTVDSEIISNDISIGDSVAINGVCLTVTEVNKKVISFDLSKETLDVTDLGELTVNDCINLEPSLRPMDYMGGHFVSGHVEEVGIILEKRRDDEDYVFKISAGPQIIDLTVQRGSMTVDGISLTVTRVNEGSFEVVIIPHTLKMTTLGSKGSGDKVNLESDLIARYIKRIMESQNVEVAGGGSDRLDELIKDAFE